MIHLRRILAHNFKQLQEVDIALPPRGRAFNVSFHLSSVKAYRNSASPW